jgi:hypothetical protein
MKGCLGFLLSYFEYDQGWGYSSVGRAPALQLGHCAYGVDDKFLMDDHQFNNITILKNKTLVRTLPKLQYLWHKYYSQNEEQSLAVKSHDWKVQRWFLHHSLQWVKWGCVGGGEGHSQKWCAQLYCWPCPTACTWEMPPTCDFTLHKHGRWENWDVRAADTVIRGLKG